MYFVQYHSWKKNYKLRNSKKFKTLHEAIDRYVLEKKNGNSARVYEIQNGIRIQLEYPTIPSSAWIISNK